MQGKPPNEMDILFSGRSCGSIAEECRVSLPKKWTFCSSARSCGSIAEECSVSLPMK
jgi:hypothetical protein